MLLQLSARRYDAVQVQHWLLREHHSHHFTDIPSSFSLQLEDSLDFLLFPNAP